MTDDDASAAGNYVKKVERSPSFPFIGLTKAIDRVRSVFSHAKRHEVRVADIAEAWNLGAKSSGTLQTIAALIAFGLLDEQGAGVDRKLRVSDLAFRILEDQRSGAKESALSEAASKPKLIGEYIDRWGSDRPADGVCISELRIDRGFTEEGAKGFLKVFDDTLTYVGPPKSPREAETSDRFVGVAEPSAGGQLGSPAQKNAPEIAPRPRDGRREDKFSLAEGDVAITFPDSLSLDSVDDLEDYIKVFLKKVRREAVNREKASDWDII